MEEEQLAIDRDAFYMKANTETQEKKEKIWEIWEKLEEGTPIKQPTYQSEKQDFFNLFVEGEKVGSFLSDDTVTNIFNYLTDCTYKTDEFVLCSNVELLIKSVELEQKTEYFILQDLKDTIETNNSNHSFVINHCEDGSKVGHYIALNLRKIDNILYFIYADSLQFCNFSNITNFFRDSFTNGAQECKTISLTGNIQQTGSRGNNTCGLWSAINAALMQSVSNEIFKYILKNYSYNSYLSSMSQVSYSEEDILFKDLRLTTSLEMLDCNNFYSKPLQPRTAIISSYNDNQYNDDIINKNINCKKIKKERMDKEGYLSKKDPALVRNPANLSYSNIANSNLKTILEREEESNNNNQNPITTIYIPKQQKKSNNDKLFFKS